MPWRCLGLLAVLYLAGLSLFTCIFFCLGGGHSHCSLRAVFIFPTWSVPIVCVPICD